MNSQISLPAEWAEVRDLRQLFGVRKALAYKWIKLGLIRTVIVKTERDAKRGKRLVELESVRRLFASQASNSPAPAGPGCKGRKQSVAA